MGRSPLVNELVNAIKDGAIRRGRISYNPWLRVKLGQVYMRYWIGSEPLFDRLLFPKVDLANLQFRSQYRGRGYLGKVLTDLETWAIEQAIELRVSEVANRRLVTYLMKRDGWVNISDNDEWGFPCFAYRPKSASR